MNFKTLFNIFCCTCFLIFNTALPVWAKEPLRSIDATVVKIADGDTLTAVDNNGTKLKIRLYGIDAPETEKRNKRSGLLIKQGQPYGEESYAALVAKVSGRKVKLDIMDTARIVAI